MNDITVTTEFDRRGRIYAAGVLVGHEPEIDTFKALAKKYLISDLREVSLLTDPPQTRFELKTATSKNIAQQAK